MKQIIGILRIYSLVDLIVLLYAVNAYNSPRMYVGGVLLWISFLLYLEYIHAHVYRMKIYRYWWIICGIIGAILYNSPFVLMFLLASWVYPKKNSTYGGLYSPLMRGVQTAALIYPFGSIPLLGVLFISLLVTLRNITGDMRDAKKDAEEGMMTIPVYLGVRSNIPYLHLFAVLTTTLIWTQYFMSWPVLGTLCIWAIQVYTYQLTPRGSVIN